MGQHRRAERSPGFMDWTIQYRLSSFIFELQDAGGIQDGLRN
jgi:hypothetical protein